MHYLKIILFLLISFSFNLLSAQAPQLWLDRSLSDEEENILSSFHANFKNNYELDELKASMMSKSSDAFEMDLFKFRSEQLQYIEEQSKSSTWSSDFKENLESWVHYNYARRMYSYPVERAKVTGDQRIRALPAMLTSELFQKVPLQNEAALESPVYRDLINYYTTYKTAAENNFSPYESIDTELNKAFEICNHHFKGQVQAYVMGQQLIESGAEADPKNLKVLYKVFSKQNSDKTLDKAVLEACEERMNEKVSKKKKRKKKRGKSKPEKKEQPFTLTDLDGKEVYLSDFHGKVIYVDFWASWCGPCRQQFPHAKRLKESFSDKELKDIVFLYISSDKTEQVWRNAIEKYDIDGTHVWSPNNIERSAGSYYQVYSIPRYMLFDKNGEVVDPNAKRPSMPGIKEDILRLLGQ
ncbi:MAG: TlpA disulfide reductase family protein [Chitinophagales bacterium]